MRLVRSQKEIPLDTGISGMFLSPSPFESNVVKVPFLCLFPLFRLPFVLLILPIPFAANV